MGFGYGTFGHGPFGNENWTLRVLYTELPQAMQAQDAAAGGLYLKFVQALSLSMNDLRRRINHWSDLNDPLKVRLDLLRYYSEGFGLVTDTSESATFQRTAADLYAQFLIIKGTAQAFVVLALVHGFTCTVQDLWWDGTTYNTAQTPIVNEVIATATSDSVSGTLACPPAVIGSITVTTDEGTMVEQLTTIVGGHPDFGYLTGSAGTGSIDYRTGNISLTLSSFTASEAVKVSYTTAEGGCQTGACLSCKSHSFRLIINPSSNFDVTSVSVATAYARLVQKIGTFTPIHATWVPITIGETLQLDIMGRFDLNPADVVPLDEAGILSLVLT